MKHFKAMTLILILSLMIVLGHAAFLWAEESLRIGIVSLRRVFAEYESVEKSSGILKNEIKKHQKTIDEKKQEITRLTEELDKQEIILSKEEKEKREEIIDMKVKALQDFVIEINEDIKGMESKIKREIVGEIIEAVKKVGEEEKYDIVLEKNDKIMLFSVPGLDITDKILVELNE